VADDAEADIPESEPQPAQAAPDALQAPDADAPTATRGRLATFVRTRRGIVLMVVVGVAVIVIALLAIPTTRYAIAGLVIKKDAQVTVVDSVTHQPVSDVHVAAGGVTATTDAHGHATLHGVPVGPQTVTVTKQYYRNAQIQLLVPIAFGRASATERIVATGYPLEVHATDWITGQTVPGARIVFGSSSAVTDSSGIGRIVLPIKGGAQAGTVTKDGYNSSAISVDVSTRPAEADAKLTAAGTLRFLSKATGVINVMQANLDGTSPQVLLTGTGQESDDTTTLLSTRDWKYSALLADRSGSGTDALYLITGAGQPVTIDASGAQLTLAGWLGHTFFWQQELASPAYGAPGHFVIKAYEADTQKTFVIDKNATVPPSTQYFSSIYIQDDQLRYTRSWTGPQQPPSGTNDLVVVDGVTFKSRVVRSFLNFSNVDIRPYEADGVYLRDEHSGTVVYYSYDGGASAPPITITDDKFYAAYPTYLLSPSGKQTFWAESRDGKNTIFLGAGDGGSPKQIATLSELTPYGWYGANDQYLLLTKNDSELYIAQAGVPLTVSNVHKITDYHKPPNGYPGYGSGYGG